MNDLITDRTPLVIAAEINTIKYQAGKILLASSIEIGRRLKEAKTLLPHGEWGKWLDGTVSYSQKTASKLMRIYEAYGTGQPDSLNTGAQAQGLQNLNYTQALILLGVPEEERAQFIEEIDIESMSTRELQKAVKDRSQALQERDQALQQKEVLQNVLNNQESQITELTTERDNLKTKAEELRRSQGVIEVKAENLQTELASFKKSATYESIQRMSKNLSAAHIKSCANKIAFLYETLDRTLKELTWELSEFKAKDPETHEAYNKKVLDFLVKSMKERM